MPVLFRNASWSGASAAFRAASGLINALLAIRLLGAVDYGHVATVLSLFILYLSLNSSIFTALVVKLMAPDTVSEKHSIMLASSSIFSVISIAVLVLMTLLLREFAPRVLSIEPGSILSEQIRRAILALGVLTTIQILVALHSALIESGGRLDLSMKCQLAGPAVTLTLLGVFFFAGTSITAPDYVSALCAGALTDLCLLWMVRRKEMPVPLFYWPTHKRLKGLTHLLRSGGALQATSLMGVFLEPLNKLFLNHFVGASSVTIYDLAMKVIWGIQYLFGAAMRVFLHLGSQNDESVGPAFSRVIALVGVPVLILHALGAVFLSWAAHHWVAIDAAQLLIFFSIATLSNLGMTYITPLYISLIGRGEFNFIFRSQAILAVTNMIVALALIPSMGLNGAAFGLLAATIYNVWAIYARCKAISGAFGGLGEALWGQRLRYTTTAALFAASILWGIKDGRGLLGLSVILLGLALIAVREPMLDILLRRMGLKASNVEL